MCISLHIQWKKNLFHYNVFFLSFVRLLNKWRQVLALVELNKIKSWVAIQFNSKYHSNGNALMLSAMLLSIWPHCAVWFSEHFRIQYPRTIRLK